LVANLWGQISTFDICFCTCAIAFANLWGQISTFDICFCTCAIVSRNAASRSSRLANRATPEFLRLAGFYYLATRLSSSLNCRVQPKCQMLRSDPRACPFPPGFYYLPTRLSVQPELLFVAPKCQMLRSDPRASSYSLIG
jgi:hypothetical protein